MSVFRLEADLTPSPGNVSFGPQAVIPSVQSAIDIAQPLSYLAGRAEVPFSAAAFMPSAGLHSKIRLAVFLSAAVVTAFQYRKGRHETSPPHIPASGHERCR